MKISKAQENRQTVRDRLPEKTQKYFLSRASFITTPNFSATLCISLHSIYSFGFYP